MNKPWLIMPGGDRINIDGLSKIRLTLAGASSKITFHHLIAAGVGAVQYYPYGTEAEAQAVSDQITDHIKEQGAAKEIIVPASMTITSITPNTGAAAGSESVDIVGTGFQPDSIVTFDGLACVSIIFVDSENLTVLTPAHAAGAVDVGITSATSGGSVTSVAGFTYA